MIISRLTLADDTALTYQEEAAARKLPLEAVLAERLEHATALDPRGRVLIIEPRSRERLEASLGGLPLLSTEDLISKVQRLARLKFGDHVIEITPGQMEELTWRAHKMGKPIAVMIEEAARVFGETFFSLIQGPK